MGRILCQRSRLYISTQWSLDQAIEEVLGIDVPCEDRLYSNLDWIASQQQNIEDRLFAHRHKGQKLSTIYLYDVTSSYLEGSCNELGAYGYNRDGKRGKMQIVVGLLCDEAGYPVSIEVFEGNTSDVTTVSSQLQKLRQRFGLEKVVFVGDRGMIKRTSIEAIHNEKNWYYLTAITRPQIETLIRQGVLQLELFSDEVLEAENDQTRYVFRRNPDRADQIRQTRLQKRESLIDLVMKKNQYLSEHKKAKPEVALKAIREKAKRLQLAEVTLLQESNRKIIISFDEQALQEASRLDGLLCYQKRSSCS
jgi:transposase